jgi:hypothetical protein
MPAAWLAPKLVDELRHGSVMGERILPDEEFQQVQASH